MRPARPGARAEAQFGLRVDVREAVPYQEDVGLRVGGPGLPPRIEHGLAAGQLLPEQRATLGEAQQGGEIATPSHPGLAS